MGSWRRRFDIIWGCMEEIEIWRRKVGLVIADGGPDLEGDSDSVPSLTIRKHKRDRI